MNDIQSASLILERRIRGHLPVTRYSVAGSGSVLVAVPDPNQPRLYHLGRQSRDADWEELAAFSVEKVTSWDLAPSADTFAAATNDDLYVFRGDEKTRVLTDRRDTYVGISMSAAGDALAVASADMLMSSFSVTLLSTDGRALWTKDLPLTLTCVQISPDGRLIAVGSEEGMVCLLDAERRILWEFDAAEPISTVCVPSSDGTVIVGTKAGRAAAIRDGGKLWDAEGRGPVTACAATPDAAVIAVARDGGDDDRTVECLSGDGRAFAAHAVPAAVTSAAYSDDGRYLAMSCRDGSLQVVEIQGRPSRAADARQSAGLREDAAAMVERGDYADALAALTRALELDPTNTAAARGLGDAARSLIGDSLRRARESLAGDAWADAAKALDAAWERCTLSPDTAAEVMSARREAAARMLERAGEMAGTGGAEEASAVVNVLLALEPANVAARELLARLEGEIIERLVGQAEERLASGDPAGAIRLLEQAYERSPSDAVRERLTRARCGDALARGLALYAEQNYPDALSQFRKVLALDPGNAEALKHLEYAEKLARDDTISDRFTRLE